MKNILRQLLALVLAFLQSIFAGGALAILIFGIKEASGSVLEFIVEIIIIVIVAILLFAVSTIPGKALLKMKGKISTDIPVREIYFNNTEGRLRRKKFTDWKELPIYATLIWYVFGSVVFFFQIISFIISLIALAVPALHSQVGLPEYVCYRAKKFQDIINFLFGFTVGGITVEQYWEEIRELKSQFNAENADSAVE